MYVFFFSSRRRHTRLQGDWSSDVCSSNLHRNRRNHLHHSLAGKPERCPSPGARERSLRAKRQSPQSRHSYQSRRYRRSGDALVTNWAFEMTLKMGDIVIARFTNSGQIKEFRGRIKGVTKNYWKIESMEPVWPNEAPGRVFRIATIFARNYSANNRIVKRAEEVR